jgi:hypothetical protein
MIFADLSGSTALGGVMDPEEMKPPHAHPVRRTRITVVSAPEDLHQAKDA